MAVLKRNLPASYPGLVHKFADMVVSNLAGMEQWNIAIYCRSNVSDHGLAQSFGIMVNYTYRLEDVEVNNHLYLVENRIALEASAANLLGSCEAVQDLAKVQIRMAFWHL